MHPKSIDLNMSKNQNDLKKRYSLEWLLNASDKLRGESVEWAW